jgi:hypothetical protein
VIRPQCHCGSFEHQRVNFSDCILNKKRIHLLDPNQLLQIEKNYQERLRISKQSYLDDNLHQRIHHTQLYRANNVDHLRIRRKELTKIRKENDDTQNMKFFKIACKSNFNTSDIVGLYVQTNDELPNFGRHIITKRHLSCPHCEALVWIEEKT